MPLYEADGTEVKRDEDAKVIAHVELGGPVDETSVTLSVYSETLDRMRVSQLLGVEPTEAWNPNERHPYGKRGRTRIVDWGKWYLKSEYDDAPVDEKITAFLGQFTDLLENWQELARDYETYLTISGRLENWNRELFISPEVIKMLADRGLALHFDIWVLVDEE